MYNHLFQDKMVSALYIMLFSFNSSWTLALKILILSMVSQVPQSPVN